jgi:hypothetical protein
MSLEGERRQLVAEVASALVVDAEPTEAGLVAPATKAYFARGKPKPKKSQDDVLGFGVAEVAVALTPIAIAVSDGIVQFLWDETVKAMRGEAAPKIHAAVRALFNRSPPVEPKQAPAKESVTPIQLNQSILAEVHRRALSTAQDLGLKPDKARLLADAMVGRLATPDG